MNALTIDTGVDAHADLLALLPEQVVPHITERMLDNAGTAAALRLLASVHRTEWHAHVSYGLIAWNPIIIWARDRDRRLANEARVTLEIAASLDGYPHAHVNLAYAVKVTSYHRFLVILDALRIAKQGVSA
ncbi:MAG TPA: hypothetical protein VFU74_22140 [Actinocrinis sp.]|nr:hypothetical protein [Actinocrinis sp.]